jgi:hypothetical protein
MEDIMALTNAQLKEKLAESEAARVAAEEMAEAVAEENEELRSRAPRARFGGGIWPNDEKETPKHPDWRCTHRFVIPPDKEAGDFIWLDFSLWKYDEEHCPMTFKSNPPELTMSFSPASPEWEAEKEAKRVKALQKQGKL